MLVVEDEPLTLLCTADDLRVEGFTVYAAPNAKVALQQLENHKDIGIMLTDIDMPGKMNGLSLSFAVRDQHPEMKIVLTSGMHRLGGDMMPAGGIFLPKPYLISSVICAISEAQRASIAGLHPR